METYKKKRELWIRCLNSDDPNAIIQQIYRMVWNAAVFRVINESRRLAPRTETGDVRINGMIHEMIDRWFFESQAAAIRRLIDSSYSITDPSRGICSLGALLKDMKENLHLMTRRKIFDAEGLEYDLEAAKKKEPDFIGNKRRGFLPVGLDSARPRGRHGIIDRLSGASQSSRSPDDTIRGDLFTILANMLITDCERIKTYVDKFVAHAATPGSRASVRADDASVTLNHLRKAHKTICMTTNFLAGIVLNDGSHGFLATPLYDQFAHIERPLVDKNDIEKLKNVWEEYNNETAQWTGWRIDEILRGKRGK